MTRTNTMHGARAILKIDGVKVAAAFNININQRYNHQPVDELGEVAVTEHILTSYEVEGDGERFRAYGKSLVSIGFEPAKTTVRDMLNHPEAILEVEDLETPGTVERLMGVRLTETSRGYQKGQLTMDRFRFVARKSTDESEN